MPAVVPEVKTISQRLLGADERPDFFAGFFVLLGAAFAERVDAAMDVGVVAFVHAAEDVDHLPRPLRAGGVVEEHERLIAVDVLLQDREVVAQRGGQKLRESIDALVDCQYGHSISFVPQRHKGHEEGSSSEIADEQI